MASTYKATNAVTVDSPSSAPRLTPEEVETFFRFAYMTHDHDASVPAQPLFWHRAADGRNWN